MVDEIITRQELINAKRDARDLGKAVNEKVIVSPRYGEDFKSLPMIAAEFQISSDAAEAAAVSAAESANIAQDSAALAELAATAATIGGKVYDTPEAGVDPITGVADGAYFNVRSSSDESYIDEYQNIGGVPTPSGKSYPSGSALSVVKEAIIDPVTKLASAAKVYDLGGLSQQDINNLNKVNFVDLIKSIQKFKNKTFQLVSSPYPALRVSFFNGLNQITYEIRKNANDDWYMFHTGFYGSTKAKVVSASNMMAKTGTWSAPDGSNNVHTTAIGSTFTFNVSGSIVQTNHLRDNRGGLFRAVIDGDDENAVTYSTYSPTTVNISPTVLATELSTGAHTVVVTFLGADPNATYASGVVPRGWSVDQYPDTSRPDRMTGNGGQLWSGGYDQNNMALGYASNKEFAVQVTYDGQNHWIPEHNNIGTAFQSTDPMLIVDGKAMSLSSLTVDKVYFFDSLIFKQKAAGRFPDNPTKICDIYCNYGFNAAGEIRCYGSLEFKVDCIAVAGYGGMLPLVSAITNILMSSAQTQVVADNSDTSFYFSKEGFRIGDYCALSSVDPNVCVAYRQNNPISTLLVNGATAVEYNKIAYWLRRDPYPKFYQQSFFNTPINAGYKWKFDASYIIGLVPDVRNILSN